MQDNIIETVGLKLSTGYLYFVENKNKQTHFFGVYTIWAMIVTYIIFSTLWNIPVYSRAKFEGRAVNIWSMKTTNDPLQGKSLLVKIPLYIVGTVFVFPFYILPRVISEVFVELCCKSWNKVSEWIVNFIPNIIKIFDKLWILLTDYVFYYARNLLKSFIYRIVDLVIYNYRCLIDSYIELKYFYTIVSFIFAQTLLYMNGIYNSLVNTGLLIKDNLINGWNSLLSLFVSS